MKTKLEEVVLRLQLLLKHVNSESVAELITFDSAMSISANHDQICVKENGEEYSYSMSMLHSAIAEHPAVFNKLITDPSFVEVRERQAWFMELMTDFEGLTIDGRTYRDKFDSVETVMYRLNSADGFHASMNSISAGKNFPKSLLLFRADILKILRVYMRIPYTIYEFTNTLKEISASDVTDDMRLVVSVGIELDAAETADILSMSHAGLDGAVLKIDKPVSMLSRLVKDDKAIEYIKEACDNIHKDMYGQLEVLLKNIVPEDYNG